MHYCTPTLAASRSQRKSYYTFVRCRSLRKKKTEMGLFPTDTYAVNYVNQKSVFLSGMGYCTPSPVARILSCKITTARSANDFCRGAFFGQGEENVKRCLQRFRTSTEHYRRVSHSPTNIDKEDVYKLEHLFLSIQMALNSRMYERIVNNLQRDKEAIQLYRQPFQQLMLLDSIMLMIQRSSLAKHMSIIFTHIRHILDYTWLTLSDIERMKELFSGMVIGHNIRRRMGKSVAVYAELARCLTLYPMVGLKALYTVHKAPAADTCLRTIETHLEALVELFNSQELKAYNTRIDQRGGVTDDEDYYFRASYTVLHNLKTITVYFYKRSRGGDVLNRPMSFNQLRCQAYTERDVSTRFLRRNY